MPKKLQNRILRDFHTGYPGINRMKSLMRSHVYWPKMVNDIRDMIEKPWSRVHVDFAGLLEDFYYLIVVDSYSKWPEVLRYRKPTTGTTIGFLH